MKLWNAELKTNLIGLEAIVRMAKGLASMEKDVRFSSEMAGQVGFECEGSRVTLTFSDDSAAPASVMAEGDTAFVGDLAGFSGTDWSVCEDDQIDEEEPQVVAPADSSRYTAIIPVTSRVEGITLFMQILGVRDQPTVRDALEARLTQLEEEQKLEAVLEFLSDPRITLDREAQTLRAHVGDGVVEFRGEPRQVALSCSDATHRILTRSIPGLAVPGGERSAVDASIACHD